MNTFSSRISSLKKETGRSIVKIVRTCNRSITAVKEHGAGSGYALTVLHNIPNDAKFIKVTTAPLCTEGLLERNLDVGDAILIPNSTHRHVGKAKDE
jgi:hypothetical protein